MDEKEIKKSVAEKYALPLAIVFAALVAGGAWIYTAGLKAQKASGTSEAALKAAILPQSGIELPVNWGDIGSKLVAKGVIDKTKFEALYAVRGGLDDEAKALLYGTTNGKLRINGANSSLILNLLWALGLANKNTILETGPMQNPQYGGAGRFASTGGWTLSTGNAMDYYSKYALVTLTPAQQMLVDNVSKNIYRPCCNNATYFPDCNHGMAMLGLLELMASQGISEDQMYRAALAVNSFWFPDTYLTIGKFLSMNNVTWANVNPKEILGAQYSSASGYQQILSKVAPPANSGGGGGCGV